MIRAKFVIAPLAVFAGMIAVLAPAWAADAAAGATLYAGKCQVCHGKAGEGNPAMAKALKVDMKPLSSADVQKKSDDELKMNITGGTGKMKGIAGLSAADQDNLVAHLRTMKK
jgi:mono/diheme cytochrome c family protein